MKKNKIIASFMVMAVVSFMGFLIEGVWMSITKGFFNNRNMHLPFLIGYGMGVILIYIIWGKPQKPWFLGKIFPIKNKWINVILYFIAIYFSVTVAELILGHTMEKICGFYWWNYTYLPLHFTRYTSVPTSILFSTVISLFMGFCFEPMLEFFEKRANRVMSVIAIGLVVIMLCDFSYSTYRMYQMQNRNQLWKIYIEDIVDYFTE